MTVENEVHIRVTLTTDSYALTCTQCGEEILHASTGDKATRNKAAQLGWTLAAMHLCPTPKLRKNP